MSAAGPARAYLEALGRELRVGRRYRRRVLDELASHIEDVAEREQGLGASLEEAQRRAIERVGPVQIVAERFSTARRLSRTSARERGVRFMAYLGACLVLACAALAPLTTGDSDRHLGIEVAAAVTAAIAVRLFDLWGCTSRRASTLLAGVVVAWIVAAVLLVSDGDALFCGQVFGGVLAAVALLSATRRLSLPPRRREL